MTIPDGPAPTGGRLSITLPPQSASCARARHAVRAFCQANALPQLADDAELLCSELVTNALQHSGGRIRLIAESAGGSLRVTVGDDGPGSVPVLRDADDQAESGRGIALVSQIAARWGTTRHGSDKSVWFRLT